MELLSTIVLGIVQGITEFLPVSSSGHLVITHHLLGMNDDNLVLDTFLHLATAMAIMFVYRNDILSLIGGLWTSEADKRAESWRYCGLLFIGTIPAGIVGVLFEDFFEQLFSNPLAAGSMLFVTATLLFLTVFHKPQSEKSITFIQALTIGLAQAVAILPGVSRSGSTIAIALLIGVSRKDAGKFSFFLALPVIIGAALLQSRKIDSITIPYLTLALGFIVTLFVGIFSLKLLLRFIHQGRLHYFGFYCVAVGILSVILFH